MSDFTPGDSHILFIEIKNIPPYPVSKILTLSFFSCNLVKAFPNSFKALAFKYFQSFYQGSV
jgi:hypothetical protein